jgi:hypothetical protein
MKRALSASLTVGGKSCFLLKNVVLCGKICFYYRKLTMARNLFAIDDRLLRSLYELV